MANRALIIGVDEYANPRWKLTSAINDARAVAAALVEHKIVAADEVELLTSPTRAQIKDALRAIYRSGDRYQRFVFYYAGHGLLLPRNAARTLFDSALVPADCTSLEDDGDKLISFDEIFDMLELVGPGEQLFIVDACRDLPPDGVPATGLLGLSGEPPGAPRSQAALYAVSPLGEAQSVPGGLGVMTAHLLAGLRGEGVAKDFDAAQNAFVVTAQSLHAHVRAQVLAGLQQVALWKRRYMEPQLEPRGPSPAPLRVLRGVAEVPFTVHLDPDAEAAGTRVELSVGGYPVKSVEPAQNHQPFPLRPQRYYLEVKPAIGKLADPAGAPIDARTTSAITIKLANDPKPAPAAMDAGTGGGFESMTPIVQPRGAEGPGAIVAAALEAATSIRIAGLEPPYLVHEARGRVDQPVPPGLYRVSFRIGLDELGEQDVAVTAGARRVIVPPPAGDLPLPIIALRKAVLADVERPVVTAIAFDDDVVIEASTAPGDSFPVELELHQRGTLRVAAASLPGRVTVVCVTTRSDGSFTLAQHLLDPSADDERVVRDLQVGQQLYAAGELIEAISSVPVIWELLNGKWTDPILGCMGWYAARATAPARFPLDEVVRNLVTHFGGLADVVIIDALHHGRPIPPDLGVPVLAESLRALAAAQPDDPRWRPLLRRLDPRQPWVCTWTDKEP